MSDDNGTRSSSNDPDAKPKPNCLQKVGSSVAGGLERFYFNLGTAIAKRPAITIACVLLAFVLCSVGLINFSEVDASQPIWVDPNSEYMRDRDWVINNFPNDIRVNIYIAESENILTRDSLLELYSIHDSLTKFSGETYSYNNTCYRLGSGDDSPCWSSSILELWQFEKQQIEAISSDQDIIDLINDTSASPATNAPFNATFLLGGIQRDSAGKIISARAALMTYYLKGSNSSASDPGDDVTNRAELWEQEFVNFGKDYSGSRVSAIRVFATRSFGDEIGTSIFGDVYKLVGGYFLIIVYVAIVLGKFNCMEQRVYLALGAVMGVGLSIAISFGLSSAFGIPYGPVQSILPFLLLGLGVDDAFVITQAWNRLTPDDRMLPLTHQAGIALKHAGVSITVTSMTDIIAFGIGATTVLPALRDFCVYATIGIFGVFIAQSTFFTACVIIDETRRYKKRNACCCCFTHKDNYQPNNCSQRDMQQTFFEKIYGPTLIRLPSKIVISVISLLFLALGIYGVVSLEQEFDRNDFIPKNSYLKDYINSYDTHFPELGVDTGYIYAVDVNYYNDASKLTQMTQAIKGERYVEEDSVDSWIAGYTEWLQTTNCPWVQTLINNQTKWPTSERNFNILLTPYLYMTENGRRHLRNIKLSSELSSSANTSFMGLSLNSSEITDMENDYAMRYVTASRIPLTFVDLENSVERIGAMDETRSTLLNYYHHSDAFVYSRSFEDWETDKIIQMELYRNMALAFGCVIIITLVLIADIGTCALVSVCVLSTLVEVGGFMHFWDLTIDTVTCIQLVLAIGLAVDYSAHIGHTFMTVTGTRNERTIKTMADIGPAVFNGGFSTFLAFLILVTSDSYVFDVFFRVNLLVVALGMWNGMVLLPVLLSWIGPPPYLSAYDNLPESRTSSQFKISDLAHENSALDMTTEGYMTKDDISKAKNAPISDVKFSTKPDEILVSSKNGEMRSASPSNKSIHSVKSTSIAQNEDANNLPHVS